MRVLVLGAGFGGLELTTMLSEQFGDDVEITLIDKQDSFVFGFSKLDVMFGRTDADHVRHEYAEIVKPGVRFVQAEVTSIDAGAKHVDTTAGSFDADFLVIALGADYDLSATPGLAEGGYEFYTNDAAFRQRDTIAGFGGGRVIVGVVSAPFKCPPAPSEAALLIHDALSARGLRDRSSISLLMPFGRPIPPSPEASEALLSKFAEHEIEWLPNTAVASVDPEKGTLTTSNAEEMEFDLFLCIPHHVAPAVLIDSGLTEDGWVPVDPLTLETKHPGVYAVGDVAAVGTPRAGVFAEGQAKIAAQQIAAQIESGASDATYSGRGACYIEFGENEVGRVDIEFFGDKKLGVLSGPSDAFAGDKAEFGASRVKRWFGRDWTNT
ncbi:MAG: NAD(P)/FAD-dependent oxidoreductase [Actinobacteria bacterium]|nr:NAD(P)/FAD-dependent oxidoreductase [Actinomycetota bacterium]